MIVDEGKLSELLDAIKSGLWTSRLTSLMDAGFEGEICPDFIRAFHGSLDASKRLHDELFEQIPSNGNTGWTVDLSIDYNQDHIHGPEYKCEISDGNYHCSCINLFEGIDNTSLSRAWIIAILEALIAEASQ